MIRPILARSNAEMISQNGIVLNALGFFSFIKAKSLAQFVEGSVEKTILPLEDRHGMNLGEQMDFVVCDGLDEWQVVLVNHEKPP